MYGTDQDVELEFQLDLLKWLISKKREECKRFYHFFRFMWNTVCPEKYVHNWHIEVMCDELELIGKRLINRQPKEYDLIINMPPAETKTIPASQVFPAWLWSQDPTLRIISSSHSHPYSMKNAMKSKDCLSSEKFQTVFDPIDFKYNMDGKGHYMTSQGGERLSTSVGSNITGEHCHLKILDDLIDATKIVSRAAIEAANEHIDALGSRNVDERITTNVLIMQRLGANDPTAYALKKWKNVRHIRLPSEKKFPVWPVELKAKYVNGVLNNKRKPKDILDDIKEVQGIAKYNAQFGQKPEDATGKLIRAEYIECIPEVKFYDQIGDARMKDFLLKKINGTADLAYTAKENNDPSGLLVFRYWENKLYLFDFYEWYLEAPDVISKISEVYDRLGMNKVAIENKASGMSVAQLLRSNGINAIDYKQKNVDKLARVNDKIAFIQAKRIIALITPDNQKRIEKFIAYLEAFPDETVPDEAADCLIIAINEVDVIKRQY